MNSESTSSDAADTPNKSSANAEESNSESTDPQAVAEPDNVEANPNDWGNLTDEDLGNIDLEDEEHIEYEELVPEHYHNNIIQSTVYANANPQNNEAANINAQAHDSDDNPPAGPSDNDDNQPSTSH